ncbi:MFS transporter [Methanolobus halotolerans]|uniref:MFS transporter n=1 Tax=Methanolobus halotolerans TaxID=2052935 RepID=A0A4E0QDK3_9EURY|nr:MFS transporter [Methanolobus halotolerans]TGC11461.1 MFS transporter [Methanolobus halotolerans]
MAKSPVTPKENGKELFPLYTVTFIGTLGFGIILTFLVFLVTEYGGNALVYGILASTYPAFQLIGAPILGKWSDIHGRKKILLLSQIGTLIAWIIFLAALFMPVTELIDVDSDILGVFAITLPLVAIFFARALDGLTGGNVSVANAYLADLTSEKERNKNYGRMSVASNLGYVVGPALAGILGATVYGEILPVSAALAISIVGTLIIIFFLPETSNCTMEEYPDKENIRKILGQEQKECYQVENEKKVKLQDVFKLKYIPFMLMLYFLIFLGFNIYYTAFPVFAVNALGWSPAALGIYFSGISAMMAFVQGPVLEKLTDRYMESALIVVGGFILGMQFILIIPGNIYLIYLAAAFFAFGNGIMWPCILSVLSKFAGSTYQGSVQGFAMSTSSFASILGLLVGGLLYTQIKTISFLIAAIIIFTAVILSLRLISIEKQKT